jgi:hypothetical protein
VKPEQEGSAFTAVSEAELVAALCVQEERVVGNDNCVAFLNRKLQIAESPLRPHLVRATVRVHQYPDGGLALYYGRLCLGRYDSGGVPIGALAAPDEAKPTRVPPGREARAVQRPGRRREVVRPVSPGNARRRHRSSVGPSRNERPHRVSHKPAKLICSRQSGPLRRLKSRSARNQLPCDRVSWF